MMRTPEVSEAPDSVLSPAASACTSVTRPRAASRRAARSARAQTADGRRARSRHQAPPPPRDEIAEIVAELDDIEEKAKEILGGMQKEIDEVVGFALQHALDTLRTSAHANRGEVENIMRLKEGNARAEEHAAALDQFK